jgi:hypothetical protein
MKRIILGLGLFLITTPAFAQTTATTTQTGTPTTANIETPKNARSGVWFNAGLGYGTVGCQDCDSREDGLSGNLTIGGTLNDRFLIGFGTAGFTKSIDGERFNVGHYDARVRFYPSRTNGFFVTGGAGIGRMSFEGESETGLSVLLGLGYDIRVAKNVSLTPFWNGYAMSNSNVDANVGQLGIGITIH